jgi:hypothetical protein
MAACAARPAIGTVIAAVAIMTARARILVTGRRFTVDANMRVILRSKPEGCTIESAGIH